MPMHDGLIENGFVSRSDHIFNTSARAAWACSVGFVGRSGHYFVTSTSAVGSAVLREFDVIPADAVVWLDEMCHDAIL
ncbi:MAG: hypothetical protein M1608_15030 [Candidatus Omnitrophica bacterium]|nr:hypothetical protein [Candidatus Omnitrophota bacterium]